VATRPLTFVRSSPSLGTHVGSSCVSVLDSDICLLVRIIWLRRVLMYHTFGPRELYYSAEFGRLGPFLIFAAPGFKTAQDKAVSILFYLRRDFCLRRVFLDLSRTFAGYK
jgi:hypothetical protein